MAETVIYKTEQPEQFWKLWNALGTKTSAGPSYTKLNVEWCESISVARNLLVVDKSFVIAEGNTPLAASMFFIEKSGEGQAGTMISGFLWAPLAENKDGYKRAFSHIDELAKENNISKIKMAIDPLVLEPYNFLHSYGFLDVSLLDFQTVITKEAVENFKGFRHGHQSDAKKIVANKDFTVTVYGKENASEVAHEAYRALHKKDAGRETRPKNTFDLQFEKMKAGEAILVLIVKDEKTVGAAYFDYDNGKAVYSSSATDPDCTGYALSHLLIYSGMKALLERGVTKLSMDRPASPSPQFDYYPGGKEAQIALFKRGFPGSFVPLYRGIKYFDKTAFEKDIEDFKAKYSAYVQK